MKDMHYALEPVRVKLIKNAAMWLTGGRALLTAVMAVGSSVE